MIALLLVGALIVNTEAGSFRCIGPYDIEVNDAGVPSSSVEKGGARERCTLIVENKEAI